MPNLELRRMLGANDFYVVGIDRVAPPGRVLVGNPNGSDAHYFIGGAPQLAYPAFDPRVTYDIFADPNPVAKAGTVTLTKGSTAVVGIGTAFVADYVRGDVVQLANGLILAVVESVTDNTHLTLSFAWLGATAAGATLLKATPTMRTLGSGQFLAHDLPIGGVANRKIIFIRSLELPIGFTLTQFDGQWTVLQDGRAQKQLAGPLS